MDDNTMCDKSDTTETEESPLSINFTKSAFRNSTAKSVYQDEDLPVLSDFKKHFKNF